MATTARTIDREWTQITDETQSTLVQIIGSADVCDCDTQPDADHVSHSMGNILLNLAPPVKMWIRFTQVRLQDLGSGVEPR
ncbi:TPA: hypothetical protein RY256_003607 [Salmonella enterica]|uniref:hypothetical protein n=1 Tax=Salmonella enterica TaxID=28901 RepID=UPI002910226D|nr:hypothetical protein [Salmonella enterica]HEB0797399.1 hypothetical protein [Salmonella enterica]HEB0807607.1 hypothetical protein [Salmonella enterica]HEB0811725.1 hypothetical protein [Salmonella enterica]HEB0816331.1 hypothetical protein [Salmonella enterica]